MANMETFEDYVKWRNTCGINHHGFALSWLEKFLKDNVEFWEQEMDRCNGNYRQYLSGRIDMANAALQQIERAKRS